MGPKTPGNVVALGHAAPVELEQVAVPHQGEEVVLMADDNTATILELYKTAVEMADRTSARRAGANSFFLTLNTALAAVVGIVSSARKPPPHGNVPSFDAYGLVITAIAG